MTAILRRTRLFGPQRHGIAHWLFFRRNREGYRYREVVTEFIARGKHSSLRALWPVVIVLRVAPCRAEWREDDGELARCDLEAGHAGDHRYRNVLDTLDGCTARKPPISSST